jgi:hypothetical protein
LLIAKLIYKAFCNVLTRFDGPACFPQPAAKLCKCFLDQLALSEFPLTPQDGNTPLLVVYRIV